MQRKSLILLLEIISITFSTPSWTWISGSNLINQPGNYGDKGIARSSNNPSGRVDSISWMDSNNNLWLFGGYTIDTVGFYNYLNDLWKFDGMNWTWISGSDSINETGTYGTKGIANSFNIPGARASSFYWVDSNNILWLFGGEGFDSEDGTWEMNDMWKFDGKNWTWILGRDEGGYGGTYGTKGIASSSNFPGARCCGASWIDSNNNFWIFGGYGVDALGEEYGQLNDLWKFNGANWIWISGSNLADQFGDYGTKGVASSSNVPSARYYVESWIDSNNNLWLFGGFVYDSFGNSAWLNDLWKFDGTFWIWISGSNSANQIGNYGTKGIASSSNIPGARSGAISWTDSNSNLWLFGGYGYTTTDLGYLNDLWKFDGVNWTWISGSDSTDQNGTYGTQGIANSSNIPGARWNAASWMDSNNTFWLFGGHGYAVTGNDGNLNDLWNFNAANFLSKYEAVTTGTIVNIEEVSKTTIGVAAGVASVAFTSLIVIAFLIVRSRKIKKARKSKLELNDVRKVANHGFQEITGVTLKQLLGKGNFGAVYLAEWHATLVAGKSEDFASIFTFKIAKKLKGEEEWLAFQKEAELLDKMRHPNVLQYLGVYTAEDRSIYIITDFMNQGSLLDVLKKKNLSIQQKYSLTFQCCKAMIHLEHKNCIHRDIAARNFLVNDSNGELICKLGDFGMARELINSNEYSSKKSIPVRWCSPEALKNGSFSVKSDVWSFGVLLFEIFNDGEAPFAWMSNQEVFDGVVKNRLIIRQTEDTPNDVYEIMKKCFDQSPENRPSFKTILKELNVPQSEIEQKQHVEEIGIYMDNSTTEEPEIYN